MPFDAVRKWTSCSKCDHLLCTCVTRHASLQQTRNFIFQTVDSFCKNVPTKMCYWKPLNNFVSWQYPSQVQYTYKHSVRWRVEESYFVETSASGRGWIPGWHSLMERKEGKRKITSTHTQKHSCNFISCKKKKKKKKAENSSFQLQRTEAQIQNIKTKHRCKDADVDVKCTSHGREKSLWVCESTYVLSDFILLLNVLHGGRGNGWKGTLWPPAAW